MSVIAKFMVDKIIQQGTKEDPDVQIGLIAVYGGSPENDKFFKYTPNGRIEIDCVNPEASSQFELGGQYYVTFEKAGE